MKAVFILALTTVISGCGIADFKCVNGIVWERVAGTNYWNRLGGECKTNEEIQATATKGRDHE